MTSLAHVADLEQLRATLAEDILGGDERRLRLYAAVYDALGTPDRNAAKVGDPHPRPAALPDALRPPHRDDLPQVLGARASSKASTPWEEAQAMTLASVRARRH